MYELPQAVNISNDILKQYVTKIFYEIEPNTPGLWRRQTQSHQFLLVVDYFGIKYENQAAITHLIYSQKKINKISENWEGKL